MFTELKALLFRYYITYIRVNKRVIGDFLLAAIIAGAMLLCQISDFSAAIGMFIFVLTLPFTFLVIVRTMLGEIVVEKATGVKEYLKLNGLSIFTYQLYLFVVTAVKTVIFTAFIMGGIALGHVIAEANPHHIRFDLTLSQMLLAYTTCGLAVISFTLFMSTLFSDPKVASSLGGLLYSVISLASLFVLNSKTPIFYYLICLFPQSALTLMFFKKSLPSGVEISTMNYVVLGDFVLYLALYLYLDQIVKDENGVSKGFFFCLKRSKRSQPAVPAQRLTNEREPFLQAPQAGGSPIRESTGADTSSAVYHEPLHGAESLRKAVQVFNLTKKFKDFTAVDNISFPIYQGQIFCLLGHNGAGKTTTIKMMSGFLDIDAGGILYDGVDFGENMDEVRKTIGICNQNDILYEKLKVHEHLELIASLRHIPKERVAEAVEKALNQVNLVNERDKFSEELSGGNKRKLSLAMAVLGDTKVVFLDEPTSGMDPQNRRVMWHTLKQLKQHGLTVLLTTHHLDEADELADRVSIMSKGKLLAMGTSEYFKKNFGVGYHLNLTPVFEKIQENDFIAMKPQLTSLVQSIIPVAKFEEQTAATILKCSLPFTTQKSFPALFAELEKNDCVRISVEMNTLEDVFVNIGLHEDVLLHGDNAQQAELNIKVEPPACLQSRPSYNFFAQTFAIMKRRVYLLIRSGRNMFLLILPLVFALIGVGGSYGFENPDFKMIYFLVVVVFAFSLNTATYASLPVYEREEKMKYLMDVMGLRNLPYWIGNTIVDCIAMTLVNLGVMVLYIWLYSMLDTPGPGPVPKMPYLLPLEFGIVIITHGFSMVTMGYAFSFLFDKALSAVKYFPLLYFFLLSSIASFLMLKIDGDQQAHSFNYISGVVGIICPTSLMMNVITGIYKDSILPASLYFVGFTVFYFIVAVGFETFRLNRVKAPPAQGYGAPERVPIPVDVNDVNQERNRALAAQDPIKAVDLVKIYDNGYKAVQTASFGVEPGQIFGLLGPNGAGKSTTFNILTAEHPKSYGSVQLLGHEVKRNMPEVFENVGICPQFNGLWEFLTVQEHLTLFGSLKGLRGTELEEVTRYYTNVLQLREYSNKEAGKLSGGNKRKLSVANAFIGAAHLLFLDEPSTGVDPLARRYLWNAIQQVLTLRKASVVLTTHSMYEAESLSHKIGILINGRFVCIGPTQYLKEKYSQGYKITVTLRPDLYDPSAQMLEAFPEATRFQDASSIQQTYSLPVAGFKFSEAFHKLEILKENNYIKDFSLYNTTLEQIFIFFSRFQINFANN